MDVGEPSVQPRSVHEEDQPRPGTQSVPRPVEEQPIPTVRVGGSSGSGTRSGVDSRASETNTDDREVKRVRFTESRGQKRGKVKMLNNWQRRRKNNILMQMLRCLHTRHGELKTHSRQRMQRMQRPEQMNSFVQSKTEVFEKIEESLRPLCTVEDLNDDEVMEL